MAINVDTVYRTVLLIMNKEQRGYLSPDEFNKISNQVQLEIFNEYFEDLNQQLRGFSNDNEYAKRVKSLEEKLAVFKTPPLSVSKISDYFPLPTPSSFTNTETFTTSSSQLYEFVTLEPADVKAGTIKVFLNGTELIETTDYILSATGENIQLIAIPTFGQSLVVQLYENNFYKLGTVIYKDEVEVEKVNRNDILRLNMSPLTRPNASFPVYVFEDNKFYIYPTTIENNIKVSYLKKPNKSRWDFIVNLSGGYVYNPSNSVDIELHATEQAPLITRILLYAGVVIKDPQIVQVAAGQIQQEKVNEKS